MKEKEKKIKEKEWSQSTKGRYNNTKRQQALLSFEISFIFWYGQGQDFKYLGG